MRLMLLACALALVEGASGQGLVKWKASVTQAQCREFHEQQGTTARNCRYIRWSVVRGPFSADAYRASGLFDEVGVDRECRIHATPSDEYFNLQRGLQQIQAPAAWDRYAINTSVVLAILDTGIDFDHPDLVENIWTGPSGEHGYTCIGGTVAVGGLDNNGHGTHVSGIAGATGNNNIGVAGVNWRIKLLSMKFLSGNGFGFSSDAVNAIEKLVDLKRSGVNIRVINNSWGALGDDPFLRDAFALAEAEGMLSICSAGNSGVNIDLVPESPAGMTNEGIVSVIASDFGDHLVFFSNYGLAAADIAAPGVDILSTTFDGSYGYLSGTSMSAPFVSGVAAMMFFANPGLTVKEARDVLLAPESLDKTTSTLSSTFGGRLNMQKALTQVFNPRHNTPPSLSISTPGLVVIPPSHTRTFNSSAIDPDGDVMKFWSGSDSHVPPVGWLVDRMIGEFFSTQSSNTLTVANTGAAIDMAVNLTFSVADGRGGSDRVPTKAFTLRDEELIQTLTPIFTAVPDPGGAVRWRLDGMPAGSLYAISSARSDGGALLGCCLVPGIDYLDGVATPGVNLWRAHVMDPLGNFINSEPVQFTVGSGSALGAPIAKPVFSTLRGPSPLHVAADFSASGTGLLYGSSSGFFNVPLSTNPIIHLTLTNLGVNVVFFLVCDPELNLMCDTYVQVFSVLPPGPRLSIMRSNLNVVVDWSPSTAADVLERSGDLFGWTPIRTGPPPAVMRARKGQEFFRLRQP